MQTHQVASVRWGTVLESGQFPHWALLWVSYSAGAAGVYAGVPKNPEKTKQRTPEALESLVRRLSSASGFSALPRRETVAKISAAVFECLTGMEAKA